MNLICHLIKNGTFVFFRRFRSRARRAWGEGRAQGRPRARRGFGRRGGKSRFSGFGEGILKYRPLGAPGAFSGPGPERGKPAAAAKIGPGPIVSAFSRICRAHAGGSGGRTRAGALPGPAGPSAADSKNRGDPPPGRFGALWRRPSSAPLICRPGVLKPALRPRPVLVPKVPCLKSNGSLLGPKSAASSPRGGLAWPLLGARRPVGAASIYWVLALW